MLLIEEVSHGEGLIVKHGLAGFDGPILITALGLSCLSYQHLKGACAWLRVQSDCWSGGEWVRQPWRWWGDQRWRNVRDRGRWVLMVLGAYKMVILVLPLDHQQKFVETQASVGLL